LFLPYKNVAAIEPDTKKLKTVVIDAGHGGRDPGALGSKHKEKDVVLNISLKLGEYIKENYKDVKVIYTREKDEFVELHERANIANENKADLFISIHANANNNKTVKGTETYWLGFHKSEENLEVAKLENSVILLEEDYTSNYDGFDPNSIESYITISVMQSTFIDQSINFGGLVQNQFRERAKRIDRGVKPAGFIVLWQTTMPSVLIETGFISNKEEEKFLASEQGQDYLASAIFRAFRDYKEEIESKNSNAEFKLPTNTPVQAAAQVDNKVRFKVQITASSKQIPLNSEFFKGLDYPEEFYTGSIYKYAVGNDTTYEKATEFSKKVKNYFPDAFIISVQGNKIIPIQEALKIEP
jgi:N-acetylmuramoyl-L-alanine amidase